MSTLPYYVKRVKYMTMGLGVFMMLASVFMIIFVGIYTLSLLIAAVFFLTGIFGVVGGSRIRFRPITPQSMTPAPIVEVRCKSCNTLNSEKSQYCSACGSQL